ncbi:MAG: RimK family alpha-L-glutamate ligase [Desulfosalsimonadaceae bacterium]
MHIGPCNIALEGRLRHCSNVVTLGVRPNFSDYSLEEKDLIRNAGKIYYPSTFYADMFAAIGKPIFPSVHTYRFVQDKIKQSALFAIKQIPTPRTRTFYGKKCFEKILTCFDFPMVGKIPRGSALGRGVFLLTGAEDLQRYLDLGRPAYIQEYLPIDRDMRVLVIGGRLICAYWRIAHPGEFRTNLGQKGRVCFDPVPEAAIALALHTATGCGWDDVGIDICLYRGKLYVLEANMKYGRQGLVEAGIDYSKMMEEMIEKRQI